MLGLVMRFSSDSQRRAVFANFAIDPEKIALRRFGKQYVGATKLGSGRDRDVYVMDEKNVLKVAKSPEGLVQNDYEGDSLLEFIPVVEEKGEDYVLAERADKDIPRTRKFLKPIIEFGYVDSKPYTSEGTERLHRFNDVLEGVDKEYGTNMTDMVANYEFEYRDFIYPGNWGWKGDMPKLVDAASISKNALEKIDRKNYSDPYLRDWRDILTERRRARKELKLSLYPQNANN